MIKNTLVASGALALVTLAVACAPPPPPDQILSGATTTGASGPTSPTSPTTSSTTTTTTTTTTTIPQPTTTLPDVKQLYRPTPIDGWGIERTIATGMPGSQSVDVVEISGGTVYVGGTFSNALRNGVTAPRANLMAVDLATGNLLPFVADTNGPVRAIASDGASLYIGGDFTNVNGATRSRIAKLDLTTGAVDPTFNASTGNTVHDMIVIGGELYLVGAFTSVDGVPRARAAAVSTTDGALDPTFNPTAASGPLFALAANADQTRLYLGGATTAGLDGVLVEVDPTTGAVQGPTFAQVNEKVEDLNVSPDGRHVYAGTQFNSAVDWNPTTGRRSILQRADGDVQAVIYSNGYLYMGFHDGYMSDVTLRLLVLDPANGYEPDPAFMPASNSYPGVFTLDADGNYLVAGGYFSTMGGVGVRGLAIFPRT